MMGIKIRKFVYVVDRGIEFEIDEMQSSHLLNAINHHQKQADVVGELLTCEVWSPDPVQVRNLRERLDHLNETITQLTTELANRSLEDDAKRDVDNGNRYDHYWPLRN